MMTDPASGDTRPDPERIWVHPDCRAWSEEKAASGATEYVRVDCQSGWRDGWLAGREAGAKVAEAQGPATQDCVDTMICDALDHAAAAIRALPVPAPPDDWPDDAAVERALNAWSSSNWRAWTDSTLQRSREGMRAALRAAGRRG